MKVGDIKIEAIKLMFTNYGYDLGLDDLSRLAADENYGSYLVNMNGSIARALDRIQNACVLPLKRKTLKASDLITGKGFDRYDTSKISDLFQIDRIAAEYSNGYYDGNAGYFLEGNMLVLDHNPNVTYILLYYPTIETMNSEVLDSDELWIPDNIARLIPYFIKGDLYQEEEPELAANARNLFEASLDDIKKRTESKQNYIEHVYRME